MSIKEKMISLPGIGEESLSQKTLNERKKDTTIFLDKARARRNLEKESALIKEYLQRYENFDK